METRKTTGDLSVSTLEGTHVAPGVQDQTGFITVGNMAREEDDVSLSSSERVVLEILTKAGRCMTTKEVTDEAKKTNIQCPDSTAAFLSRLRMKNKIEARYSRETKVFVWWAKSRPPNND